MIKFLAAGLITLSLSAPPVDWKEITTDFSHWSYYSQKETKELQKAGHCFVWRPIDVPVFVKTPKKDKK